MSQFRFVYPKSPLFPIFHHNQTAREAQNYVKNGAEPVAAVALTTMTLMWSHVCQLKANSDMIAPYELTLDNFDNLALGYTYPISTIAISAVCKKYQESERTDIFEKALNSMTLIPAVIKLQEQIYKDLRGTINILKMDPSGELIFEFLSQNPYSQDEFFLNGSEIAKIVFFGISQALAQKIGDRRWLPYGVSFQTE